MPPTLRIFLRSETFCADSTGASGLAKERKDPFEVDREDSVEAMSAGARCADQSGSTSVKLNRSVYFVLRSRRAEFVYQRAA